MLRANRLKQQLQNQQLTFGLFCSMPYPQLVEMIGLAGFDFVIIDSEHALINPETLEHMIRAAEAVDLTALVRVPPGDAQAILRVLDAGAQGVVVPHVNDEHAARAAVRAARYAPEGMRSLNTGRPSGFARMDIFSYIRHANDNILVVPMIESQQAVANCAEILAVPGVDMILEGAADLSQSLGIPWQTRHPEVRAALTTVQQQALQQKVPYCAIPRAAEDRADCYNQGVRAFVLGDERSLAFRALSNHIQQAREQFQAETPPADTLQ